LNELDTKVSKCNIVPSNAIEETLKKLHSFTEEHAEKQPIFNEIDNDFNQFDDKITINQSMLQYKVRFLRNFSYYFL